MSDHEQCLRQLAEARDEIDRLRREVAETHDALVLAIHHAGGEVRIPDRDIVDPPALVVESREDIEAGERVIRVYREPSDG